MRFIKRLFNGLLDSAFAWFTPSWRREGHAVSACIHRYLRHYDHQLDAEVKQELQGKRAQLKEALLNWDKESAKTLTQQITARSESLRHFKRNAAAEMLESLFVIMVVFLGIRTYYAQPFRIPTGSMQPSLNGIVIHPIDETPALPERLWNMVTLGSSYMEEYASNEKAIVSINDRNKWLFFMETVVRFDDGSEITIPSARGAVIAYLKSQGKYTETPVGVLYGRYQAGELIIRGRADAGDMIIVNRMAYHFRKPQRGESFVFDTRGINTSGTAASAQGQEGGTHYIKRLCGLPGDTLNISDKKLFINGQEAQEPTIQRVIQGQAPYNTEGYVPVSENYPGAYLTSKQAFELNASPNKPLVREYAALGDNTTNSLDSRYWGPVRQYNIIGPAGFALWPFTSHWGIIP